MFYMHKLLLYEVGTEKRQSLNFSRQIPNYRLIALVTVVSTFFENILLELMEPYLSTTANQFGFKKGHSTDHCIYVLKNVIQYYRSYNI